MTTRRDDRGRSDRDDREYRKPAPPREQPRAQPRLLNEFFIDGDGINREVLQYDICKHLGPDATCRPARYNSTDGFLIKALRPFTPAQLEDLKSASAAYQSDIYDNRRRGAREDPPYSYTASRLDATHGDRYSGSSHGDRYPSREQPSDPSYYGSGPNYFPSGGSYANQANPGYPATSFASGPGYPANSMIGGPGTIPAGNYTTAPYDAPFYPPTSNPGYPENYLFQASGYETAPRQGPPPPQNFARPQAQPDTYNRRPTGMDDPTNNYYGQPAAPGPSGYPAGGYPRSTGPDYESAPGREGAYGRAQPPRDPHASGYRR